MGRLRNQKLTMKQQQKRETKDFSMFLIGAILSIYLFCPLESVLAISKKPVTKFPVKQKILNWGLDSNSGAHINIKKTWEITEGSKEIIVAVIDTGIDPKHPDLKDNLWNNPKSTKGEYGWDFIKNKANPVDEHGHGTHVAGIIGGKLRYAGASGVAQKVSIMPIRYYAENSTGADNVFNTVKAIHYAIDNGAHIINYSGGGAEFHLEEYKAIDRANRKGILFVAAAGNERSDIDKQKNKYYPGAYPLPNIISVAATDIQDKIIPSSNWGIKSVDVAAPGEHIFSTLPNGKYGYLSGTSQATAFVTGLAVLLLSQNRNLSSEQIKTLIMNNVDKVDHLKGKIQSAGRVNSYKSMLASLQINDSNSIFYAKASLRIKKESEKDPFLRHPDFPVQNQNSYELDWHRIVASKILANKTK